jgi:hypothetical protein
MSPIRIRKGLPVVRPIGETCRANPTPGDGSSSSRFAIFVRESIVHDAVAIRVHKAGHLAERSLAFQMFDQTEDGIRPLALTHVRVGFFAKCPLSERRRMRTDDEARTNR